MTRSMMSTDELWRMFQEGELERHRLAALNKELVEALQSLLIRLAPQEVLHRAAFQEARAVLAKAKS